MPHPLRSLLLTFDQLAPEQITASTTTVTLSQHYRHREGWHSVTGDADLSAIQNLNLLLVTDGPTENVWPRQQPVHTSANFACCTKQSIHEQLQNQIGSAGERNQTLWIHVDNATSYSPKEVSDIINACRRYGAAETLFAVTAFKMVWEQAEHCFDVLANDNLMRVPAVLEHADFAGFSLQAVTSSQDVLHTLLMHAMDSPVTQPQSAKGDSDIQDQPCDLRMLATDPGMVWPRRLSLQFQTFRAVRSENFLYVAEMNPEISSNTPVSEGLYAKPQDRWNAHNVCSEYIETTDTMRKQLGLD
ncbi:MAG: hypothetical protein ABJZ55_16315 [Fuerstiella sp.]